ncbi:MAG: Amidohydro-rel protein [Actinomycetota bacterium]|nr:Amidohydro-rel protein [Actinomycetota bacterium]
MNAMPEPLRLPGLVDLHVHLRDPGQTAKEDFLTGTGAALAGGFTTVLDMPNNAVPVTTSELLEAKGSVARSRIVCDTGLYLGSLGEDLAELSDPSGLAWGLKLYLNRTTGGYLLDAERLSDVFLAWHGRGPILVHAEADVIGTVLAASRATGRRVHVCHVSRRAELEPILAAKADGTAVTCGVTPHHLFLTEDDARRLGPFGEVRPRLAPRPDVDFLWEHLDGIDVVESDHAPHTTADKEQGAFGFPGLETTLPLLLQAEREGQLTRADIVGKCALAPRTILGLPEQPDTVVEIEPVEFEIGSTGLLTRAGWTPFAGRPGFGRVHRVTLRGERVFEDGQVLAAPGSGRLLRPSS